MSYMALYRKFRPREFDDVKGQDHIVTTLKNQIVHNRIGHAYLFCGTRGTGKTTIAKIFARAINCEHPIDGSPCGECASCKSILDGSSMDVVEMHAASNNGVENIRQLREDVRYGPTQGRYKVYIIDEAHMITSSAFNAFLKTLEEPPSYVVFILATTEVNSIPITILSRCQRYDFKRITADEISLRMKDIMEKEGQEVTKEALDYVARVADGSMRDGLSMLDQCIAFHLGKKLTYDSVLDVLGAVDNEVYFELTKAIKAGDSIAVIRIIDDIFMKGREVTTFVKDYIWFLRNLMISKASADAYMLTGMSAENYKRLRDLSSLFEMEVIERYIRILSDLSSKIRFDNAKRVLTEIAFLKLIKPQMERDYDSILNRVAVIEDKLEKGIVVSGTTSAPSMTETSFEKKKVNIAAVPEDIKELVINWQVFCSKLKSGPYGVVIPYVHPNHDGDVLELVIDYEGVELLVGRDDAFLASCQDVASQILPGKDFKMKIVRMKKDHEYKDEYEDLLEKYKEFMVIDDDENNFGKEDL